MYKMNRDKFFNIAQRFIDDGLLKEVYSDNNICVFNVSDQTYVAFGYIGSIKGPVGFLGTSAAMRSLIENPESFLPLIWGASNNKDTRKFVIRLNNNAYNACVALREITNKEGISSDIDFEFEEEMMKLNKQGMSR